MTYRDLLENHADVVYHSIAALQGLTCVAVGIIALVRYLHSGTVDAGLFGGCSALTASAGVFMAGGVANARWNPNGNGQPHV